MLSIDTAEMTGKMLINSNEELRLMKAQMQGGNVAAKTAKKNEVPPAQKPVTLKPSPPPMPGEERKPMIPVEVHPGVLEYNGKHIQQTPMGIYYGQQKYRSIEEVYDILSIDRSHIPEDFRKPEPVEPPKPKAIEHLGRAISPSVAGFTVDGKNFSDLDSAKGFIESTTLRAER